MTNKLVVIVNSLKVPKIKKLLLYEMKILVPNYSCLQNPWLGGRGYRPHITVLCPLPSTELVEAPPRPNKIPGYATAFRQMLREINEIGDNNSTTVFLASSGMIVFWSHQIQNDPCSSLDSFNRNKHLYTSAFLNKSVGKYVSTHKIFY